MNTLRVFLFPFLLMLTACADNGSVERKKTATGYLTILNITSKTVRIFSSAIVPFYIQDGIMWLTHQIAIGGSWINLAKHITWIRVLL